MNLSKETILAHTDSYKILNHYLRPYVPEHQWPLKHGRNISNPFLDRKQNTPSFNIYKGKDGTWRYNDFSTSEDTNGDCFDLVMNLYDLSFPEALERIAHDFLITDLSHPTAPLPGPEAKPKAGTFQLIQHPMFPPEQFAWWKRYGISEEHLDFMRVASVQRILRQKPGGRTWVTESSPKDPIFAYQIEDGVYKVYRPRSKDYRFFWLGQKPKDYVFGLAQLPEDGDLVILTGGEKDVISLYAHGYSAISLNSETAIPPDWLMEDLKARFSKILVLYDLDSTGEEMSMKLAELYGLRRAHLPREMYEKGMGKDISDFCRLMNQLEPPSFTSLEILDSLISQAVKSEPLEAVPAPGSQLEKLLRHQAHLRNQKSKPVIFSPPILYRGEDALIYPRTINVIQGKSGVHKSRLAEAISSTLLNRTPWKENTLGFEVNRGTSFAVCYVDTERNLSEQFPYAIQQIQLKAGYPIEENPENFHFVSLLDFERDKRFSALTEYIDWVRTKAERHLFVVLDVVSDCIGNFNQVNESMELVDAMNRRINHYDVTFLCVIHENPGNGSEKARGHLGTELANKASTVMQVGFEKDGSGKRTDLIKLAFLKCRASKSHDPVYLQYCSESKGLILAENDLINSISDSRKEKAPMIEVKEYMEAHLQESIPARELVDDLCLHFDCSRRVIERRLARMIDEEWLLKNETGEPGFLVREGNPKNRVYRFELAKKIP